MILVLAIVTAVLFAGGIFLILQVDAMRVVAGTILISNAAIFFLLAGPGDAAVAPILPAPRESQVADPVVQALGLTAIVIGFAVTAVLLGLTHRLFVARGTLDLEELAKAEQRDVEEDVKQDIENNQHARRHVAREEETPWC
jgi:multicomponent Na+:H+ antiporter subunit C